MCSPSEARRAEPSSSSMAISAVATVTPCGALPTLMPRALQASRSMWSKPIENVEMHLMFSGTRSITGAGTSR